MEPRTVIIDPVTRIEGHAKITLKLRADGAVEAARFHVTQFRGFEKLCEGRPYYEMPSLMARICGICPVSHLIASSKACDAILAVAVPANGERLRRILNMAQILQSHALSVFHLSSPDLLLGMDAPPETRNLVGVAATTPDVARDGIRLRQIGQRIIEILAGKRIHPAWAVPGGVSAPLTEEKRDQVLALLPDAFAALERTIERFRSMFRNFPEETATFANFPSLFAGLTDGAGRLEFYDGPLRVVNADGELVAAKIGPSDFEHYFGEVAEDDSYLKSVYYKPLGYPEGMFRVGPLARLNVATNCGTPRADHELGSLRQFAGSPLLSSFHYHHARLIEMLYCCEKMTELLEHPDILSDHVRASAQPNAEEGIGISEAPRGTLMHHYKVDRNGLITWANLIIATGNNNLAMNKGVEQAARHYITGGKITEGALNRIEAVIRTFDPCLSCSTHAAGRMPLDVTLIGPDGELLDRRKRG
ncbi:MAG TPA: Ni/Fe hydrogenase subunit alpha [Bryobacteraceae bacterium]|nr:Ni/Fe hydrogenase subunit alpha [Bryobacteraceae bacterium]